MAKGSLFLILSLLFAVCSPERINAQELFTSPISLINLEKEVADPVGRSVDELYSDYRELMPTRSLSQIHHTDNCREDFNTLPRFIDRIAYFVWEHMHESRPAIADIASYYDVSTNEQSLAAVSLVSQPMCQVSKDTLTKTMGAHRVPGAKTIDKINQYVKRFNEVRKLAQAGDQESVLRLVRMWSRFMSCLAYEESLTTADLKSSELVAEKYAPAGYRKPSGVTFFEDLSQSQESRLNIGLYQFTPLSFGNIKSCIKDWNRRYPGCEIGERSSRDELVRILGSSYQTFNAYCGVNKIIQTYAIQINTTDAQHTHPANKTMNGNLIIPEQRCVSLHFYAGWAYNHFGPLQNTTGTNLESLMTCALGE